jgi:hypothetical protein
MYSWEIKEAEKKIREQFDNILERWIQRIPPEQDKQYTGHYLCGFIDGLYIAFAGSLETESIPILNKVRDAVHADYAKMFQNTVKFG